MDSEWRTPEHEVYEREWRRAEAAERRGPWPIPNLVELNHKAMDAALAQWRTAAFEAAAGRALPPDTPSAERTRNLAAWKAMTPAEQEAEARLCLEVRREMEARERRDATYTPEAGDVVHRVGDDERHERREDEGVPPVTPQA